MGRFSEVISLDDFKAIVNLIHGLRPISSNHSNLECFGIVTARFEAKAHPKILRSR